MNSFENSATYGEVKNSEGYNKLTDCSQVTSIEVEIYYAKLHQACLNEHQVLLFQSSFSNI